MSAPSLPDAIAFAPRQPPALTRQLPLVASAVLIVAAAATDTSALGAAAGLAGLVAALLLLAHVLRRAMVPAAPDNEAPELAAELDDSLRRLSASEERYRAVVEHAGDPILTFDLACTFTSLNPAAERFFGWERHDLLGADARRLFAADSVRALAEWTRTDLLTSHEPVALELEAVHREGRVLCVEARAAVLRKYGIPFGVELVCRDVTAHKELDRVRSEFLAMMGHDIRNPLGAIFGYTEMLLEAGPLPPDQRDLLLRINSNTRTVLTLVGNFLDSSQIDARQLVVRRRSVDVHSVVHRTVEQYTTQAQLLGVPVVLALAPELPEIAADPLQIERIIANLLTNAIKFTPRGGCVTVSTERLPSSVALAITDTGIGIAPREFSRIFQRYTRSGDTSREGTGLGLYIVGTLVDAHGGFVTVDSTPGAGTTFTAYLPITDWRAVPTGPPQPTASVPTFH